MAVTTTARLGLTRWSAGTDPFSRAQMDASMAALEANAAMYAQGTEAARPAFGKQGRFYFATDTKRTFYDTGTAWEDSNTVPVAHNHTIADLPVAASGTSSASLLVRSDDARLSNARTPLAHTHAIGDLPVAASGVSSATMLVRADDERLDRVRPGMMVVWPVPRTRPVPTGWVRCDGQSLVPANEPALFAEISTTWGGDGSTGFNVPNMTQRMPYGSTGGAATAVPLGSYGGSASRTILEANLPAHTHSMAHTHDIGHGHGASATATNTDHNHTGYTTGGEHEHTYQRPGAGPQGTGNNSNATYSLSGGGVGTSGGGGHGHTVYTNSGMDANATHSHTITVNAHAGSSGASSAANTGATGGGTALDVLNPYAAVDWIIKL